MARVARGGGYIQGQRGDLGLCRFSLRQRGEGGGGNNKSLAAEFWEPQQQ